jgi:hypothetical protein
MEDAVVVTRDAKGQVQLHQPVNLTAAGAVSGAHAPASTSWPAAKTSRSAKSSATAQNCEMQLGGSRRFLKPSFSR